MGRSAASPSGATGGNFDNTTSPLPYANSPRSGATMINVPSPQQQTQQQHIQQQQRPKLMQLPQHQQQLLAQQQLRQSTMQGLGQVRNENCLLLLVAVNGSVTVTLYLVCCLLS